MRTLTNLLAIGLLSFTALHAQESNMSSTVKASEMYADGFSKFRFGGYGDTATTEIYTLSLHDALPILNSVLEDMVRWLPVIWIMTGIG